MNPASVRGPNPLLEPESEPAWDDTWTVNPCVIKVGDTYHMYYEGFGATLFTGFSQVGHATSVSPLGPWVRDPANPVLNSGPPGSWDERHIENVTVLQDDGKLYMYYSGVDLKQPVGVHIGVAVADSPWGPWHEWERNPVLADNVTYVHSVFRVVEKYYMFYGGSVPFLAIASSPLGPFVTQIAVCWARAEKESVGISSVVYLNNRFHYWFTSEEAFLEEGASFSRATIRYAWSDDGLNWQRAPEPAASPSTLPGAPDSYRLSDVQAYVEGATVFLYYTGFDKKGRGVIGVSITRLR